MTPSSTVATSMMSSRHNLLSRLIEAARTFVEQHLSVDRDDAREVATIGSVVRVFAVDALRETTLFLAPAAWSGTTSGMVAADSPIGAALLGGRVTDVRTYDSPSGPKRLQIVAVDGRLPHELTDERRAVPEMQSLPFGKARVRRTVATPLPAAA